MAADTMVRYVLQGKMNLVPDRDVKLLPMGEPAIALQAQERGVVDAATRFIRNRHRCLHLRGTLFRRMMAPLLAGVPSIVV